MELFFNFHFSRKIDFFSSLSLAIHSLSTDCTLGPVQSSFLCIALFDPHSYHFSLPFTDEKTEAPMFSNLSLAM